MTTTVVPIGAVPHDPAYVERTRAAIAELAPILAELAGRDGADVFLDALTTLYVRALLGAHGITGAMAVMARVIAQVPTYVAAETSQGRA